MAKETAAERRARIQKEVAEASAARREAYFAEQAKAKETAKKALPPTPPSDAFNYQYSWRQEVGGPGGQFKLTKTPNPFYDVTTNTILDPVTGKRTPVTPSSIQNVTGNTVTQTASNAVDAALSNRSWLSIDDPIKALEALGKIIGQYATPGSSEYMSAFLSAANMGSRSHTDIRGEAGTLAKFLNNNITFEQGKALGINTLAAQIGSDAGTGATLDSAGNIIRPTKTPAATSVVTPSGSVVTPNVQVPTGTDPAVAAMIKTLQDQNNALMAMVNRQTAATEQSKIDTAAADAAAKKERSQNAILALTDRFNKYGLGSLVPKIRELAISGAGEDTIALQLQETPEYKQRFIGNEERIKKGLRVLDPGTYLGLEDRYRQIIRAYGLKQFDNDAYVTQFIANDVSPEEVSSRVVNAVQRVQNADPAVSAMLRQYYNIGVTDMVAYVLDPTNQLPKIERQIGAAEIGVAAGRQGLQAGVNVAEQLAAQGVTQAEAQRGYATIADILPQTTKLSEIYTGVLDQYGQAEAEQEVFNSLASAQRKRRALAEREIASFGGASGLGRTSLDKTVRGTF